ncbi:hypothetical protein ACWGHM_42275 [Streptomyces sp. NPDC054904]
MVADTDALPHLRLRLYDNVPAPGSDTDGTPASSDNRASLDKKGGAAGAAAPGAVEPAGRHRSVVEGRK